MNAKRKGNLWERIAQRTMEMMLGLEVHTTERKMIRTTFGYMSLKNDIYGCMDHVAMSDDSVWFVQTTAGGAVGEKIREILEHKWPMKLVKKGIVHVEIWRGVGGKKGKKWNKNFKPGTVEVDKWYFQRYRIQNDFKMIKGDIVVIPPEVIDSVFSKNKHPKCKCGKPMKKDLERKIGECAACIRLKTQVGVAETALAVGDALVEGGKES